MGREFHGMVYLLPPMVMIIHPRILSAQERYSPMLYLVAILCGQCQGEHFGRPLRISKQRLQCWQHSLAEHFLVQNFGRAGQYLRKRHYVRKKKTFRHMGGISNHVISTNQDKPALRVHAGSSSCQTTQSAGQQSSPEAPYLRPHRSSGRTARC